MPCIIFVCTTFLCQKEVLKTKIIIFGAGEPYQTISEFFQFVPRFVRIVNLQVGFYSVIG